jgi:transcriptional regulator with XRE-family HTH domain
LCLEVGVAFDKEALRAARVRQRLTQEELAVLARCSAQTIRSWEQGWREPSDEHLFRLAYKLHIQPHDLTTERPEPVPAA